MTHTFLNGYALLIGVNENAVPGWELPAVAQDVAALAAVLTHPGRCAYAPGHVRVLTGQDATRDQILDGLAWLKAMLAADPSGNETALVYYSGHGWQDNSLAQPAYYLVPSDVVRGNLRRSALRADDFAAEIASLNPARLLALLDCCHAGGMGVKELEPASLAPFSLPPAWLLGGQKAIMIESGAKGMAAGLLQQGSGRAVLNSSRSDEKSYIRQDGTLSIFTYHLIEALTGYAPHAAADKEVTAADLLSHVWRTVPLSAQADHRQPQHPDGQISGNFAVALLLGGEGAPPGKSLPDPREGLSQPAAADLQAPVHFESGRQIKVGDIHTSGGTVNIAGGDIVQKR